MDRSKKKLLIEDVKALSLFSPEIEDGIIRNLSGLLRKLIVEDCLIIITNEYLGKRRFFINAHVIRNSEHIPHKNYTVFAVDANRSDFTVYYSTFVPGKAISPEEIPLGNGLGMIEFRENIPLHEFRTTAAVSVSGVIINRAEIIKYVANKMQGVHKLDRRRDNRLELERKYRALDPLWDRWGINGGNSILTTLLGIAQEITSSASYKELLDHAKQDFPELFK
jgi:hypothetical protein